MKLHELTHEALGLTPPPASEPPKTYVRPDPDSLTREQALMALKSAYRQLVSTNSTMNNKGIAMRLIAPAIKFVERLQDGQD